MKKLLLLGFIALTMTFSSNLYSQSVKDAKEIAKERKINAKLSESELNAKCSKQVKQDAKKYTKEGWIVKPGALPITKQLEKAYNMQYEYVESPAGLVPKYIYGEASSVGEIYDAAKKSAIILAQHSIADVMGLEIAEAIKVNVGNEQLKNDAVSVAEVASGAMDMVLQKLGRMIPVIEMYRNSSDGKVEVLVRLAYSEKMAKEMAKDAMREELKNKGIELQNKLEDVIGF